MEARDHFSQAPISLANKKGHEVIVELLRSKGK